VAEYRRETELPEHGILKRFYQDDNTNIRFADSIQGPFLQYNPAIRFATYDRENDSLPLPEKMLIYGKELWV
jgi:hypothetical protein